jgi:hypothetical protein
MNTRMDGSSHGEISSLFVSWRGQNSPTTRFIQVGVIPHGQSVGCRTSHCMDSRHGKQPVRSSFPAYTLLPVRLLAPLKLPSTTSRRRVLAPLGPDRTS